MGEREARQGCRERRGEGENALQRVEGDRRGGERERVEARQGFRERVRQRGGGREEREYVTGYGGHVLYHTEIPCTYQ